MSLDAAGFVRTLRDPLLVVGLGLLVSGCGINTIPSLEEQASLLGVEDGRAGASVTDTGIKTN